MPGKYLTGFFGVAALCFSVVAHSEGPLAPAPELDPSEVASAMMAALKKGSPQGIAELYSFSSPGNRASTGSIEQFSKMIQQGFPDMLGHQKATFAPPLIDSDRAMIPVQILSRENELSQYVILLSRQSIPECDGCWMADAVIPPEALQGGSGGPEHAPQAPLHQGPT